MAQMPFVEICRLCAEICQHKFQQKRRSMGFPQNLQHKDDISFDFQKTISVVIRGNLSILVFFVLLQKLLIPPKKPFVEVLKEEGCAIFGVTPSSCKDSQPDIAF